MGDHRLTAALAALVVLSSACAPSAAQRSADPQPGALPAVADARNAPTRVTLAAGIDPTSLANKLDQGGLFGPEYAFIANSPLVILDPSGSPHPLLAADLPSRDRGSWVVNPDGTMATTWKIRPNALWHDEQPVVARDSVFALQVYMDDAFRVSTRHPEQLIARVDPDDEKTFTIRWKQTYPWANRLLSGQLNPLPYHIVGEAYESGDRAAFANAPFWTSPAYVGTGPYRLVEWEKGVHLSYRAFDRYFLGRPQIDEVVVKVVNDVNTVVANLLGGGVDVTLGALLTQAGRVSTRQQWDVTGEGQVITTPTWHYNVQIQHDPVRSKQPALADLRVRRALLHAIDRATIAEAVSEGTSSMVEAMIAPNHPLYVRAQQVIMTYPFDRTRALALLQEAGWARSPSGALANARAESFMLDIIGTQQADNANMMNLIQADLMAIGMQVTQTPVSQAQNRDNEFRAKFPGISVYGTRLDLPTSFNSFASSDCPTAERRYTGRNRGCYSNPEVDRLFAIAMSTLEDAERDDAMIRMFRTITGEVASIGISYFTDNIAVRKGLIGPGASWQGQTGTAWNIHEWRWSI